MREVMSITFEVPHCETEVQLMAVLVSVAEYFSTDRPDSLRPDQIARATAWLAAKYAVRGGDHA